jgi:asparagine synthase (glutamine-hydrolysing)
MCGICGATDDRHGEAVSAMNQAMVHRGPDDDGCHVDAATGLAIGARRLSIIDLSGGHQPLSNEDGTIWAALNGEIYNHPDLRRMLQERGHRFASETDTEVLVHLYEEFGAALVHALDGMFAFAIWDSREERLVIARDPFGEKPLFYAGSGGQLTFASELTALLASGRISPELDPVSMHNFFVLGYLPGARSMVVGVSQLLPGHTLTWQRARGVTKVERYWEPPGYTNATNYGSLNELVAETRRLLEHSVRGRMISDVPLGVFLSGGLDSTLVAAIASQVSSAPVKTFAVGYEVGTVSETAGAAQSAAELGTIHHELTLTEADVAARLPDLISRLDQPLADQSLVALHAVAEFARREVTVVVGGEGADELFGGYPRYRWMERARQIEPLVPQTVARLGGSTVTKLPISPRLRRLAHVIERDDPWHRHLDWVTDRRREHRSELYGPKLAWGVTATITLEETRRQLTPRLAAELRDHPAAGLMLLDQLQWLPGDVLTKADRASMLCSLEVRTPFLTRELAELAGSVPAAVHVRGPGKNLLRHVLAELLPQSRLRRTKTAFRVPAARWLRGPLAPVLRDQLDHGALYRDGWINRAPVLHMVDNHVAGRRDWTHILWPLLSLGLWIDRVHGVNT